MWRGRSPCTLGAEFVSVFRIRSASPRRQTRQEIGQKFYTACVLYEEDETIPPPFNPFRILLM